MAKTKTNVEEKKIDKNDKFIPSESSSFRLSLLFFSSNALLSSVTLSLLLHFNFSFSFSFSVFKFVKNFDFDFSLSFCFLDEITAALPSTILMMKVNQKNSAKKLG